MNCEGISYLRAASRLPTDPVVIVSNGLLTAAFAIGDLICYFATVSFLRSGRQIFPFDNLIFRKKRTI